MLHTTLTLLGRDTTPVGQDDRILATTALGGETGPVALDRLLAATDSLPLVLRALAHIVPGEEGERDAVARFFACCCGDRVVGPLGDSLPFAWWRSQGTRTPLQLLDVALFRISGPTTDDDLAGARREVEVVLREIGTEVPRAAEMALRTLLAVLNPDPVRAALYASLVALECRRAADHDHDPGAEERAHREILLLLLRGDPPNP